MLLDELGYPLPAGYPDCVSLFLTDELEPSVTADCTSPLFCRLTITLLSSSSNSANNSLSMAVDFFTQVGTPFSVLQYSFSPQTVLAQLTSPGWTFVQVG